MKPTLVFKFINLRALGFPILAFIPFLLLKYHKADASAFDDNSIMILVFFIAILIYIATMVTEFKLRICPNMISNISHLSAPLTSISLVMIPFPYLGCFLFVTWIGFFVKLALDSYQELFQLLGDAARCVSQLIWNKLLRLEIKKEEIKDQSSTTSITSESTV